ncbi:CHASE2 domain-containing protein [Desulfocurvibacter africanus]|uniref:CHASE2 domain-containing protein n=1 Tax=Desulfocurvibacter africanus TaxID=873 RepID=UPI002FDB52DB
MKRISISFLFVLSICWGLLAYQRVPPLERIERIALDWQTSWMRWEVSGERPMLIAIGERSLSLLGQWPWPRSRHARLVERLASARIVAFDILFSEKGQGDLEFANAMRIHGRVILASHAMRTPAQGLPRLVPPVAELLDACRDIGLTNVGADIDGTLRFLWPILATEDGAFQSLPIAVGQVSCGKAELMASSASGSYSMRLCGNRFIADKENRVWLDLVPEDYDSYEYVDVLAGRVPEATFQDRVIFVGMTAAGLGDVYALPHRSGSQMVPGVIYNIEAYQALRSGLTLMRASPLTEAALVMVLALVGGLLALLLPPGRSILLALGLVLLLGLGAVVSLHGRLWLGIVGSELALGGTYMGLLAARSMRMHSLNRVHRFSLKHIHDLLGSSLCKDFDTYLRDNWDALGGRLGMVLLHTNLPEAELPKQLQSKASPNSITVFSCGYEGQKHIMLIPLADGEATGGYCVVGWRKRCEPQIPYAIGTTMLSWHWYFTMLEHAERLNENLVGTIRAICSALDVRDVISGKHSERVSAGVGKFLERLQMDRQTRMDIHFGALIHDIGKIGIPDNILNKTGSLSPEEFEAIKQHPLIGSQILASVPLPQAVVRGMLEHHERYDGKGYPHGLKGEEISLAARVIAVVDVFDALSNDRPYRKAMSKAEAIEVLEGARGTQLDPELVDIFVSILRGEG